MDPRDETAYGRQVVGSSALSLTVEVAPEGLVPLLGRLARAYASTDYKRDFGFIDFVEPIQDRITRERLDNRLVDVVAGRVAGDAYLAPPEPISYDDVEGFLHFRERASAGTHAELELDDYRSQVDPGDVSAESLRSHIIRMISPSTGLEFRSWSVYRCLVFETELDGQLYLLSEGDWFAVDRDFVARIDGDLARIEVVDLGLPDARRGEREGDYNRRAATEANLALLDRRNFQVGGSPIEVADLASTSGDLIHVKRKTQSATLSHLFAQGRVSAETLKIDPGLRARVADTLHAEGRPEAAVFSMDPYRAGDVRVVYAVIASNAADLPGRLPFFSRLNLWHARRFLAATLDYRVAFSGVRIT